MLARRCRWRFMASASINSPAKYVPRLGAELSTDVLAARRILCGIMVKSRSRPFNI